MLYFDGCPNHEALVPRLREVVADADISAEVELRRITDDDAREPEADRIVRVTVDPDGEPAWKPKQAVALAAFGEGGCLAQAACPHINLFASADAANRYLLNAPMLRGRVLSIPEAAEAGRWVFGNLLDSLDDAEAR